MIKFTLQKFPVILLSCCFIFGQARCAGELTIVHSPQAVKFSGTDGLKASDLADIFSACMGYTVHKEVRWDAMSVANPFHYPKAVVVIAIDGISTIKINGHVYPLKVNADLEHIRETVMTRTQARDLSGSGLLVSMDLDSSDALLTEYPQFLEGVSTKLGYDGDKLNLNRPGDVTFLREIQLLKGVLEKMATYGPGTQGSVLWFRVKGIQDLTNMYGPKSDAVAEGQKLVRNVVEQGVLPSLEKIFGDRFILALITNDESHVRRARNLQGFTEESRNSMDYEKLNVSKQYGQDYAVIFNILLWSNVFIFASLIAISVFICTMDPGRDSIVYRMTTQRGMKKEN